MNLFLKSIFLFSMCFGFSQVVIAEENEHEIFEAVTQNNIEGVKKILLENRDAVVARNEFGETPLHKVRSVEVAQLLLEHGAKINAINARSRTPVYAVLKGEENIGLSSWFVDSKVKQDLANRIQVIKLFLAHGARANVTTTSYHLFDKEMLLFGKLVGTARNERDGLSVNDIETIKRLVEQLPSTSSSEETLQLLNIRIGEETNKVILLRRSGSENHIESSRIFTAVMFDDIEGAKKILERNKDAVNSRDKYGSTPLHYAFRVELDRLLLEHGAEVNSRDKKGRTPLHNTSTAKKARLLLEHGAEVNSRDKYGSTPLHYAFTAELVRVLLEHGAEVNSRDKKGQTPLHNTSTAKVARLLLEHGAEVNSRDVNGQTPLHYVSAAKKARVLLEHGAEVNSRDVKGQTPLHYVSAAKKARVLLEHGAEVNSRDVNGQTPLHNTSTAKVARVLLEHGAEVNSRDVKGQTPLHYVSAAKKARVLLEYGADKDAKDDNRETPLHKVRSVEVVQLLLEHGAKINTKNKAGYTPLYMIIKKLMGEVEYRIVDGSVMVIFLIQNGAKLNIETLNQEMDVILFAKRINKVELESGMLSLEYMETVRQLVKNEMSGNLSEDVLKALDARIAEKKQRGGGGSGGGNCPKSFE